MASVGNHQNAKSIRFEQSSEYNDGEANSLVMQNGILYFNGNQLSSPSGNQFDVFSANYITRLSDANIKIASNLFIVPGNEVIDPVTSNGQGFQSDPAGILYYNGYQVSAFSNIFGSGIQTNVIATSGASNVTIQSNLNVENIVNFSTSNVYLEKDIVMTNNPSIQFNSGTLNIEPIAADGHLQVLGNKNANVHFISTDTANTVGSDISALKFMITGDSGDPTRTHTATQLHSIQTTAYNVAGGGGKLSLECRNPIQPANDSEPGYHGSYALHGDQE